MPRTILLAEDSATQAERVRLLLEREGYRVSVVRNGREGVQAVDRAVPDLIISDVVMPEMDGYAFCRAVKTLARTRHTPFVLLTERRSPLDIIKGLERGADNFITKPFEDDYLLERVRRMFEQLDARRRGELQLDVTFRVGHREISISADKQQIIEMLFSTFEELCALNGQLEESRREVEAYARNLEAMAEERARELKTLFEGLPLGLVRSMPDGRLVDVNPALVAMLGYPDRRALLAVNARDLYVDPADPERVAALAGPDDVVRGFETAMRCHDGRTIWVRFSTQAVRDGSGALLYHAGAVEDVTARKHAEEEMERQREALQQSEKVATLGSLLAGVAHELNNPLSIVVGQASVLREEAGDVRPARRAEKIAVAAERCVRIVRNFLGLARRRPPERSAVDLNRIVREAVELLAYELRTGNVEVVLDLDDGLPSLWADAHQLHQVVVNLLVNAHQAMRSGPRPWRIDVRTRAAEGGRRLRLEVADTGPGVPAALRTKIFEAFFTTKATGEGTGLGLSLCRGIVSEHGGSIEVADAPSGGARFLIDLPVVPRPAEAATPAVTAPSPPVGPHVILVVDDEPDIAELLAEVLSLDGHRVTTAADGAAALELATTHRFDLVVTDTKMPGMDGLAFYRELQRRLPTLARRVLFVTGDELDAEKQAFLEASGTPSLAKPFDPREVRRLVNAMLSQAPEPRTAGE